jgi:mRNA interferase MazF
LEGIARGSVIVQSGSGDFDGKPRPAVVVQASKFIQAASTLTICPLTSAVIDGLTLRITISPSPSNGLQQVSQVQLDRITTVRAAKVGAVIGHLSDQQMAQIDDGLRLWLALP